MIRGDHGAYSAIKASCTIDAAVATLLDRTRSAPLRDNVDAKDDQWSAASVSTPPWVNSELERELLEMRELAREMLRQATTAYETGDETTNGLSECQADAQYYEALVPKAKRYLQDIAAELGNANDCSLQVDTHETDRTGKLHLTLGSLELWARNKYGIEILDAAAAQQLEPMVGTDPSHKATQAASQPSLTHTRAELTPIPAADKEPSDKGALSPTKANEPTPALKSKNAEPLVAQRQDDQEVEPDADIGVGLGRTKAKNVLRTLAILISAFGDSVPEHESPPALDSDEGLSRAKADQVFKTIDVLVNAFSSAAPRYRSGGAPNESAIALHLADVAHGETGQSGQAIRKTIAEARKRSLRKA